MRRRRGTDKWEVTLSHKDPITGEQMRSFRAIEAKTEKQAQRKRDEDVRHHLIRQVPHELEQPEIL